MTSVRRQIGEGGAVAPGGGGGGTLRRGGTGLDAGLVRGTVNIVDVATRMLGLQLSKATNGELEGLCPLHDDHNPSFRLNVRKQRWFCNSTCGGGDVFNLVERVLGVDFPTALRRVAEFAGLAVPGDGDPGAGGLVIDPAKAAEAEQRAREAEAERERDEAKRRRRAIQAAQRTWAKAVGNREHEHVRRYVEGRGVPVAALPEGKLPVSVGYVADLPLPAKDQEDGAGEPGGPAIARGPAAVLRWTKRVVHPDGKHGTVVTGVQRIYLATDGDGKRQGMKDAKVTLGSVSQGGAVKLNRATADEGVTLWLCEGPETGLALLAAVGTLPGGWATNEVWSLLAAPQVRHLALAKVPEAELGRRVSRLVIAGDLDKSKAGQKAAAAGAATLAADLAHVGLRGLCEVAVALPDQAAAGAELVDGEGRPVSGKSVDWLDVVARHGVAEAGRRLADAAARGPVAVPVGDGEPAGAADAGTATAGQDDAEAAAVAVLEAAAGDGGGWGGGDQDTGGWDERRDPDGRPILDDDRTLKARSLLRMRFAPCRANDLLPAEVDGAWRVQCYQNVWYIWHRDAKRGTRWVPISQDQMHAMATATFAQCVTWQKRRFRPAALAASGVDGVLKAAVYYVDAGVSPEDLPRWLPAAAGPDGRPSWRSPLDTRPTDEDRDRDVIAVRNGLVHVGEFLQGQAVVRPHTSRWFNTVCLPFTIQPERLAMVANEDGEDLETVWREVCPRWMAFLAETFGPESQCIEALQRWFGYCLSADCSHQKVLYLQGLPGTGKGTIREVLTCILGEQNVHNATMDELAGRFDVAPMVGKAAVVIPEIEMDSKTSKAAALTRLKSITGGDPQSVERKHRERVGHVRIRAKFVLTPNSEPNLPDSSAALIRRLIVVPMGRPPAKVDPTLPDKLKAEATGILLWALVGLRRVRTAGGLLQPEEGQNMLEQMRRNMSPVRAFVDDWCVVGPGESVECGVLRDGFARYCRTELGVDEWSAPAFGRAVQAAIGGVRRERDGTGDRAWRYVGLRPLLSGEDQAAPRRNVHVSSGTAYPGPAWLEQDAGTGTESLL